MILSVRRRTRLDASVGERPAPLRDLSDVIGGKTGEKIATVRFTMRDSKIRIIGAGYWRKGQKLYEKENRD